MSCSTCEWWTGLVYPNKEGKPDVVNKEGNRLGICRKNAPSKNGEKGEWPETSESEKCGEYEANVYQLLRNSWQLEELKRYDKKVPILKRKLKRSENLIDTLKVHLPKYKPNMNRKKIIELAINKIKENKEDE